MTIEIEVPQAMLSGLFDSETIPSRMSREAPGGATIRLPVTHPARDTSGNLVVKLKAGTYEVGDAEPLTTVLVEFAKVGKDVAIGVFSAWLYDKLKCKDGEERQNFIRVNRVEIGVTPDAITRVLVESNEIEERK
jgi:hypothetical protein